MDHVLISKNHCQYRVLKLNWAGLGVVEVEGKVRCIPLTRPNESVRVKWHDAGWGRFIGERIDNESMTLKLETDLGCPQARRCTGCTLRHLSPIEQQQAQQASHLAALSRLSGLDLESLPIHWLEGAPRDAYRVRVTAQLWSRHSTPSTDQSQTIKDSTVFVLGLRARWGQAIDLAHCANHPKSLRFLVDRVTDWINQNQDLFNDPLFSLTRVSLQSGEGLPEWLVLHFEDLTHKGNLKRQEKKRRLEHGESFIRFLQFNALIETFPHLAIYAEAKLQDQQRSTTGVKQLTGQAPRLWECQRGIQFVARPPAWLPQSPSTLESLRTTVSQCLWNNNRQPPSPQVVFELGCGIGVLSIALTMQYPSLQWIGVDHETTAIDCARESARLHQVGDRVQFIAQDGRRALAQVSQKISCLVIHAMRRPLSGLLALAAHRNIQRLCYLAPSAPALGRDLAECKDYTLDRLFLIDQMPGTAQAMTIAQLTLNK